MTVLGHQPPGPDGATGPPAPPPASALEVLRPRLRTAGQQFAIGPGWRRLVLDCHHRISAEFPSYELLAVKQKYGRLSFQAFPRPWRPGERSWTPDEHARLHDLLDATTARSESLCERCAAPARLRRTRRLWLTLCDACEATVEESGVLD
ncbi:hypothetical protein [Streptomyces albidoflavus]|uniref:hypothetical protein n=1 Tax=Streptomyces albidoflavus TaxID=1886 RepID=UPI00340AE22B